MGRALWAVLAKDVTAVLRQRQVWIPMLLLPLIMTVFMPSMMVVGLQKGTKHLHGMAPMLRFLPPQIAAFTDVQKIFYITLNFMFPPLFLMIPLVAGSVIGASCLVGEKEHHTLETLLYTPITLEQLLLAKLVAAFIPSYAITLLSFGAFTATVNVMGGGYLAGMVFPNLRWLVLILLVAPAVILFGLSVMVIISAYASTFQGAQQLSGFIILPFLGVIIAQTAGVFALQTWHLLAVAPALLLLDWLLLRFCARHLSYERLLR